MKNITKHDVLLALIIAVLSGILTWAITSMYYHNQPPLTIESPVNKALIKHSDSLEAIISFRDMNDAIEAKKESAADSVLNKNHIILSKHYENLKNLDIDSRLHAYDSILANYKVRR